MNENDAPYAYLVWLCSVCDSETVATSQNGADLLCEQCGNLYRISGHHAALVPAEDEE